MVSGTRNARSFPGTLVIIPSTPRASATPALLCVDGPDVHLEARSFRLLHEARRDVLQGRVKQVNIEFVQIRGSGFEDQGEAKCGVDRSSAKEVKVVDVPPFSYLMIDGCGDPNTSPEYARAVEGHVRNVV